MKIGIVHMGFFYSGGGERTVLSEARELGNRGIDVTVYAPTVNRACFPELMDKVKVIEFNRQLPKGIPVRDFLGMTYSSIYIPYGKLNHLDLIIAHGQPSNWIAYNIRKRYSVPYISYLHQVNRLLYPRKVDKDKGWNTNRNIMMLEIMHKNTTIMKKLDTSSVKGADKILTNSNWIKNQIKETYREKSEVCYPGVNENLFHPKEFDRLNSEHYILSTNRHYPQKRLDYVIPLMAELIKHYPSLLCFITGGFTNYTRELRNLMNKTGLQDNIHFTGIINSMELVQKYRESYLYTYTSPEEDLGLGPLEAASCGVPSVVWDHAGPKETVIDNHTGFRAIPYDMNEFVEKHLRLLENRKLRDKLGRNARRHVLDKFTWEKHGDKLMKTISSVI